jgi:hypothetical protein
MIATLKVQFIEGLFIIILFAILLLRFYTRWKDWESWYSQSFGLHFSLREEQWQEDWAFILSLASQVRMFQTLLLLLWRGKPYLKILICLANHVGSSVVQRKEA